MRFGFELTGWIELAKSEWQSNVMFTYNVWNPASEMFEQTDSVRMRVLSTIFGVTLLLML